MGKRNLLIEEQDDTASKRVKYDGVPTLSTKNDIKINSVDDLRQLLTFHQDDITQYRLNLQAFRQWIESDGHAGNGILLEYLTSSVTTTIGDQIEALPDVLQAWRYAVQVYDEGLMPAIPGVLVLLIRTISSGLKYSEIGIQICKTIVRKENISLLQKCMNSSRTRDTTIARCLDLLTQIVSFDGGACARNVWLQRSVTLQRLPQFLGMSKKSMYSVGRLESVRDFAISFFLANLRYQDSEGKADVLSSRKTAQIMLRDILAEPLRRIMEMLSTLRTYVLEDQNLARSAKGQLLTDDNLVSILAILRHNSEQEDFSSIRDAAEDFLLEACSSRNHGVIYKQHGWYPPGTEELVIKDDLPSWGGGSSSTQRYTDRVPVRNTTLASFIQDLKPWSSMTERRLILGIFEAAPELVADYFIRKKAFSFEPKLTATWVGWATFIYSAIRLPPLINDMYLDGRPRAPPPVEVVLQSILPQPLSLQSLTKALKHQSGLIRLFTLRILVASFEKLRDILNAFRSEASPQVWHVAASEILNRFSARCPEYKVLLSMYHTCSKDKHILRELVSANLALYNTVAPQLILDNKFEVSSHITRLLIVAAEEANACDASQLMELEHLLEIGDCVIDAKWWQKPDGFDVTSVTAMLQLLTTPRIRDNQVLKRLISGVLEDSFVLSSGENLDVLEALISALSNLDGLARRDDIYKFLDDCLLRLVRKPIKYYGDVSDLSDKKSSGRSVAPLHMVICEQWPFFSKAQPEVAESCAIWICDYLSLSVKAGESSEQLQALQKRYVDTTENKNLRKIFKKCKETIKQARIEHDSLLSSKEATEIESQGRPSASDQQVEAITEMLDKRLLQTPESENHPALTRWAKKDISEAVLESDLANLINCLISSYPEVRLQAVPALRLFMQKAHDSKYDERNSIYLLIGVFLETVDQHGLKEILPTLAISIAARSTLVLSDPIHTMYAKVNHFLSRTPSWDLAKLPSYWMDRIFHKPPTQMNAHWAEVDWLLETLLDGLRTTSDVNLYRRTGVFERIIVNCTSTFTPRSSYEKMVDILYRCAMIGGATTLITRFGILSWITAQKCVNPKAATLLTALDKKIRAECDAERVFEWSDGAIRC